MGDLQQIAKFRAELEVCDKLMKQGATHTEAMFKVFGDDGAVIPVKQNDDIEVTLFNPDEDP